MNRVSRLSSVLFAICLVTAPVSAQQSESLDDVDQGASVPLDEVPTASGETPDSVDEPGSEDVVDSATPDEAPAESLDAADSGATATPDEVDAADASTLAPDAPSPPLGPPPAIVDGNFADQANLARDRMTRAQSNVAYWDHAYADMIRRNFPVGAEREALIGSRDQAHADLANAERYVAEVSSRAAAAGQPID